MTRHTSKKQKGPDGQSVNVATDEAASPREDTARSPDAEMQSGAPPSPGAPPGQPRNITTSSLSALQNKDFRQVMDIVDDLRLSGLSGELQLPQLVVCGDQSSGKSSVLEAITEIPFPRKENLCTRFATEIILRRAPTESISINIIPDKHRVATETKKLEGFNGTIDDFKELPDLIDKATNLMEGGCDKGTGLRAFFRDVLRIDIAGPERPHLRLVDLPGVIHAANKYQTKQDVEFIGDLVQSYIKQKRTIILAVISAKNDLANQVIITKCLEQDPDGLRTLGIITKPDCLESGSGNEHAFIELANNRNIPLSLGWHILKNRPEKQTNSSFTERNSSEAVFFSTSPYCDLPPRMLGIHALRVRLSDLLYNHLKTELPALQHELNDKLIKVTQKLKQLGVRRGTSQEQRYYLATARDPYIKLVDAATMGHYEDSFFGKPILEESAKGFVEDENTMRRLRAVVQYLNQQFAQAMREHGKATNITSKGDYSKPDNERTDKLDDGYAKLAQHQSQSSRSAAISRVGGSLVRSRGKELPCTVNPLLINQLFLADSLHWKDIAEYHIQRIADVCSRFLRTVMASKTTPEVATKLFRARIDKALQRRLSAARSELANIIEDNDRGPITYDPSFVNGVQQLRFENYAARMERWAQEPELARAGPDSTNMDTKGLKADKLKARWAKRASLDMDKASAEDALDISTAYYNGEVEYFIAVVTKQVIERHLLANLAANTMPTHMVTQMSDEEVAFVAGEPEGTTHQRKGLEDRKATLEKGQRTFDLALGWMGGVGLA